MNHIENARHRIKDIVLIGMMTAAVSVGKQALSGIMNVEVVTPFLMMFTLHFGWKAFVVSVLFVLTECLQFGFGLWVVMYFYIWPLLVLVVLLLRRQAGRLVFAEIAGFFGLFFGMLCSLPYFAFGGWKHVLAWWIQGIPADVLHAVSNAILMFVLYLPLNRAMIAVKRFYYGS